MKREKKWQLTDDKIIEGFFEAIRKNKITKFQELTVQLIVQEAGISKPTFYTHFESIEELLKDIRFKIDEGIPEKLVAFEADHEQDLVTYVAREILPMLYNHRDWLKVLYGTAIDPEWHGFLQESYMKFVIRQLKRAKVESYFGYEILALIIVRNIITLISVWLTQDEPATPAIFEEEFIKILAVSTRDIFITNK